MRPTSTTFWTALLLALLALVSVSAQSTNCHACIRKAVPLVSNCTSLSTAQLDNLDKVMIGSPVYSAVDQFKTTDAAGFGCLTALMWDSVQYKGKLWNACLDPANSCPWAEMMQWMEIIPKLASIYGAPSPPAQVLVGAPA
ncbi:hypothetical protein BGZ95_010502 [Linnemannia exigua]|uniref:Uncharacterized protein n=1 Tax=Linnemannia exigua TaxID=604196 RepID=A0AAD4H739_9FUNG|nr:hypothetical protein BGZ95_010502 [Linnemannia exigua]